MADFSTAGSGGGARASVASTSIDVAKVKRELQGMIRTVLQDLAGGQGKREGNEFLFPKRAHGGPGDAIRYNMASHKWSAFNGALSPASGQDIISFVAAWEGLGDSAEAQVEAARKAAGWYLGWTPENPKLARPTPQQVNIPAVGASQGGEPSPVYDTAAADYKWDYVDAAGNKVIRVYRWDDFDGDGKKVVRPWDYERNGWSWPHDIDPETGQKVQRVRPLFNLPGIQRLADDPVVMVEGEKAADAVESASFLTTTVAGGESGIDCTDYLPLQGRDVVLWPDNDDAGNKWLSRMIEHLKGVGVASIRLVTPPDDFETKWDAADVPEDRRAELIEEALGRDPFHKGKRIAGMKSWAGRVVDHIPEAKPVTWLLDGVFPNKTVGVLAAPGGVGKGVLVLDLLLRVASNPGPIMARILGREIKTFGKVVLYSGEDSQDDLANRLKALDPSGQLIKKGRKNLVLIPFRNASGEKYLFTTTQTGTEKTEGFMHMERELKSHDDIAILVIDPVSKFVDANIDVDNRAAAFVMDALGDLAEETGICIILVHHTHKGANTHDRSAIRGAGELVNGSRAAALLMPCGKDETKSLLKTANRDTANWEGMAATFRVVKGNYKHNETPVSLLRNEDNGLLEPVSAQVMTQKHDERQLYIMVVEQYARLGFPFMKTVHAQNGFLQRTQSVPDEIRNSKHKMQTMVDELLAKGKIVAVRKQGRGTTAAWLDVPNGPLAKNAEDYEFVEGHEPPWAEVMGVTDDDA